MSLQASLPRLPAFDTAWFSVRSMISLGASSPMPFCGALAPAPPTLPLHVHPQSIPCCSNYLPVHPALQYPYSYTPHLEDFFSPFFQGEGAANPSAASWVLPRAIARLQACSCALQFGCEPRLPVWAF